MITVKLGELKNIVDGLNQIMKEKLPVKTAYSFTKLAKKIQKEVQSYEESRMQLIERYCARDEFKKPIVEGNQYKILDRKAFQKDFTELSNIEVEIDFNPVSVEQLGDIKISPLVMISLEKFIEEIK